MVLFYAVCIFSALLASLVIWVELDNRKKKLCGGLWHRFFNWRSASHQDSGCMGDTPIDDYYCGKCDRAFRAVGYISENSVSLFEEIYEVKKGEHLFERTKNYALGIWKD